MYVIVVKGLHIRLNLRLSKEPVIIVHLEQVLSWTELQADLSVTVKKDIGVYRSLGSIALHAPLGNTKMSPEL